jgi:hypothetical protein
MERELTDGPGVAEPVRKVAEPEPGRYTAPGARPQGDLFG